LARFRHDPVQARASALRWFDYPAIVFKRLALYAASKGCIAPAQWLDWLLRDEQAGIWSVVCQREVMRLLATQAGRLESVQQQKLQRVLLESTADVTDNEDDPFRIRRHQYHISIRLLKLR